MQHGGGGRRARRAQSAVGSRADRDQRPTAVVLGTVIGAVIGAKIGHEIDENDRACMRHSLELAPL